MTVVTLDVVLVLPPPLRQLAIQTSTDLAASMDAVGGAAFRLGDDLPGHSDSPCEPHVSLFRLGDDLPGHSDSPCEPHVSLFMMAVEEDEVPDVAAAVAAAALTVGPVPATASEYRHNREGAPEVFFERSNGFRELQRAVIGAAEPLRRGRLREFGPGGEPLAAIVDDPETDPARVRQLQRYGFDDVSDDVDDRFQPHVTLCWPRDETNHTDLSMLPPVGDFSACLIDVALYGMGTHGTCTRRYGSWTLTGAPR